MARPYAIVVAVALCLTTTVGVDACEIPVPLADARLAATGFVTTAADDAFRLDATVAPEAVADPSTSGLMVVLSNEFFGTFARVSIPGGSGWRPTARGGWSYSDRAGTGIVRVRLRPAADGSLALRVDARRGDYASETRIRPIRVTVAFSASGADLAQCSEAFLSIARCAFVSSGNTLHCLPPPAQRRCGSDLVERVRCDARNAAAAQDANYAASGMYYSGACAGLPGFTPSPDVVCVTGGDYTYSVVTGTPTLSGACIYSSNPPDPAEPNLVCSGRVGNQAL